MLKRNISVNRRFRNRVHVEPAAVSTHSGSQQLYGLEFGDSMSRFNPDWHRRDGQCNYQNLSSALPSME